jgi:hypothetical protein
LDLRIGLWERVRWDDDHMGRDDRLASEEVGADSPVPKRDMSKGVRARRESQRRRMYRIFQV